MLSQSDVLTVKGAKYRKSFEAVNPNLAIDAIAAAAAAARERSNPDLNNFKNEQSPSSGSYQPSSTSNKVLSPTAATATTIQKHTTAIETTSSRLTSEGGSNYQHSSGSSSHHAPAVSLTNYRENDPYWKKPLTAQNSSQGELVVIHVCDENQQITRDFCCNRSILIENMKYFDRFLGENENGYDDIDISVHCDVEIFEWLMTYIHDIKHSLIKIDKNIIISILISSEFLQMDELVEVCIEQVAQNLNEIIRLPIDLSCISEKLINRIAAFTHPKTLCEVKDKKDKILTKLYKRRVELDFSRKGSGKSSSSSGVNRTIASSLTCCRYCGWVYLESFVTSLVCRQSAPSIDYRGRLISRHAAIPGWSLTSYLKSLHSGGMGWDSIYWHVWAACIILRGDSLTISALEADRYQLEPDGIIIRSSPIKAIDIAMKTNDETSSSTSPLPPGASGSSIGGIGIGGSGSGSGSGGASDSISVSTTSSPRPPPTHNGLSAYAKALSAQLHPSNNINNSNSNNNSNNSNGSSFSGFSLGSMESIQNDIQSKLHISFRTTESWMIQGNSTTPSLNPNRPPEVLTPEIFDLLCSQMKHITGLTHRNLLQQTMQSMIQTATRSDSRHTRLANGVIDFLDIFWGNPQQEQYGGVREQELSSLMTDRDQSEERRRGRSPARTTLRTLSLEPRRAASQGMSKARSSGILAGGQSQSQSNHPNNTVSGTGVTDTTGLSTPYDSDNNEGIAMPRKLTSALGERRARSSSTGKRMTSSAGVGGGLSSGSNTKSGNLHKKRSETTIDTTSEKDELDDVITDAYLTKQIEILRSMPADLFYKASQQRGSFHGIWIAANPLQLHPPILDDMLQIVADSNNLPDNKKLEWDLDLMREFDERRIDRMERYLVSTRQPSTSDGNGNNNASKSKSTTTTNTMNKISKGSLKSDNYYYYKDRGRQAFRCVI